MLNNVVGKEAMNTRAWWVMNVMGLRWAIYHLLSLLFLDFSTMMIKACVLASAYSQLLLFIGNVASVFKLCAWCLSFRITPSNTFRFKFISCRGLAITSLSRQEGSSIRAANLGLFLLFLSLPCYPPLGIPSSSSASLPLCNGIFRRR